MNKKVPRYPNRIEPRLILDYSFENHFQVLREKRKKTPDKMKQKVEHKKKTRPKETVKAYYWPQQPKGRPEHAL